MLGTVVADAPDYPRKAILEHRRRYGLSEKFEIVNKMQFLNSGVAKDGSLYLSFRLVIYSEGAKENYKLFLFGRDCSCSAFKEN